MREPLIIKLVPDITPEQVRRFRDAYNAAVRHGPPLIVLGQGVEAVRYQRLRTTPRLYAAMRHRVRAKVLAKRIVVWDAAKTRKGGGA